MNVAVRAGVFFFILLFAARVVLGFVRGKLIVPNLGDIAGLAFELPLILLWAWLVCGWLVRKLRVPTQDRPRIVMGVVALALILVAETVAVVAQGKSLLAHLASYDNVTMLLGMAVQIAFAAMPWLRLKFVLPRRFE